MSASTAATASPQGGPHIIKTQRVSKTQRILTLSNGEREAETVKHIAPGTIQVRVSTLPLTGTDYFECTVYAGGSVGTGSSRRPGDTAGTVADLAQLVGAAVLSFGPHGYPAFAALIAVTGVLRLRAAARLRVAASWSSATGLFSREELGSR